MSEPKTPTGKNIPAAEFYQRFPNPAILQFQPGTFKTVSDPELPLWEELMKIKVGLKPLGPNFAKNILANGGTCCESGDTNDCDQD